MRFGLLRIAPQGQDIRFDEKQVEEGRNFANKIWNAARFYQMQEPRAALWHAGVSYRPAPYVLDIESKLRATRRSKVDAAYKEFRFNEIGATRSTIFSGAITAIGSWKRPRRTL